MTETLRVSKQKQEKLNKSFIKKQEQDSKSRQNEAWSGERAIFERELDEIREASFKF